MRVVGLTGGMGSGKSTVASMLGERGARVIDADAIARQVVEPGRPALDAIAARFGDDVIGEDGALDRGALAAVVFADPEELAALEEITHPAIREELERRLATAEAAEASSGDEQVVVVDHPLLVESGYAARCDVVVVVEAPVGLRLDRLESGRGIDRADARARIEQQASDAERREVADHVLVNDGDEAELERSVTALWEQVTGGRVS